MRLRLKVMVGTVRLRECKVQVVAQKEPVPTTLPHGLSQAPTTIFQWLQGMQ